MEAWFNSSEISTSCGLVIKLWQTETFEVKPDCITIESWVPLNSASLFSKTSCRDVVPIIVLTAAVPMPYFLVASMAASFTFGWLAKQR